MENSIVVEELEVGDVWNGKKVISVDPSENSVSVIFWLQGEPSARCFNKGTKMLVERKVMIVENQVGE